MHKIFSIENEKLTVAIFSLLTIFIMLLDSYFPPPKYADEIWTLGSLYLGYAISYLRGDTEKDMGE